MSEKFYFAEQFLGRQTTPAGGGVDRLEAARSRMPAPVLITKSGDNMFLHDEHGRQVFTFEGWKENREAAKAWGDIAKEAFKHLATGFGQAAGDDLSAIPPNVIESALRAVDGWGDILKGVGRFGAKPFRTEEEEDEADYTNYLELTNKFHRTYGVYKKDGEIVPHGTPGAEEVVKPQSNFGDFFRSLAGDGSSDFKKGAKALAGNADQVINPQWADSWSLVMDPVWLVPGGQLGKVQKILSSGGKPGRVLQALKSVKETAGKVPGASRAAEALGTMFSKPTTTTAGLAGRAATKIGKGGERLGAYVGEGWALKTLGGAGLGYGIYQYRGEDLIDLLVAGAAGVGSAKMLPKAIAKAGAATRVAGETVTAGVKGAEIGKLALGTAYAAGEYSEKTQKMLRLLDSTPLVNRAVRLSGEISNAMAKGSAFGAGMGYLVAGEEGAAAGMGIGVLGGPIGMGQGYAISKLASGKNRVQFRSKDQDGNIVIKEAESFLGIPEQDLIANWLAKLPESDRESLPLMNEDMLYGMALMDAWAMGLTRQGEGDLNIRYMTDDQIRASFPDNPDWVGKEGIIESSVDGKPLVVVNMSHAENPLRTLAHELFHPEWTTGRGEDDPLMMARAEIEGKLFGIKAADGSDAIPGMFSERQFRYLEANYLDRLFSDNPVGRADQENRPMQERRTLIMAEMLSEHFGNFAEAGKGDVVAHARKVLRRAGLDQEGEPSLLAKVFGMELTKYQTALLGRMREAFEYLGIKFDAAGNPTSSIFKDPRTAKWYKVKKDGSVEIRGTEGLMNAPEIDNLLAQYVLAKDRQLKRLGVSDKSIDDGAVVTAKEVLAQKDPTIVEQFKNSGMFQLDDEGNVKYMAGMPVLLTRKQRVERDLVVNEAIFKALDSVARAEHAGEGLIRKENAEGEVSYGGRYMSKEQLDALMALPDEVVPRFMKAKIRLLNENLAKGFDAAGNLTGSPALNFLISYYKATTGSRYTSKAKMSQQHASPYGWAITQAGNFNLQTFSIGRFESKINKWWKKAQGGNKRFANFFDLFGGDPDAFRGKVVEYLNNQVHGRQNPSGAQKDAIADFLNALPKAMKDLMPDRLSTDKEHVVPISLRVDRMEEINPTIGTAMPVHYDRLKVNFMPTGEPKLGGKKGSLVPKKDRVKTGHPPRVKPLEEPEVRYMPAAGGAKVARVTGKDTAVLDKDFSTQFMPSPVAPNAVLKDFHKKKVQILTTDLTVAADKAVDGVVIKFGGGPGHLGWHDGWGFTGKGNAEGFGTRWRRDGEPLIGITSMTPNNHLNQPLAREYYTAKWREVIEDGLVSRKLVDKHVREVIDRVIKSKATKKLKSGKTIPALPDAIRERLAKVKTFKQFSEIFHDTGVIPWTHAPKIYEKLDAKTLPISNAEQVKLGTDLESIAHATRQPEYHEAPTGSLLAIAEYDGTAPTFRPDLNKAYPWFVPLKEKAFLKQFHDVRKLSTDKDLLTPKGKANPGTMMGKGIILDRLAKGDVQYMPAGKDASPGWKLTTDLALDKIQKANPGMKSMKGQSMLNALKKQGALEEEIKWVQDLDTLETIDTWMKGQDKVTPQQVKDFIDRNTIDVLERTYGGKDSEALRKAEDRVEEAERDMHEANERGTLDESIRAEEEWREHKDDYEALLEREGTTYDKDDLVLPGAKEGSYKELVLRLPSPKKVPKVTVEERSGDLGTEPILGKDEHGDTALREETKRFRVEVEGGQAGSGRGDVAKRYATRAEAEVAAARVRKLDLRKIPTRKEFTSPHFKDDPNVILHLRMNERVDADGKRMLFIEELQSDWAARGRDKGFKQAETVAETQKLAHTDRERFYSGKGNMPDAEWNALSERVRQWDKREAAAKDAIPAAPFVAKRTREGTIEGSKKWKSLGMKRAIRWAAENGYDRLGWISGKDTAQRYNLRKHIETLEYDRLDKGFTRITAVDKDGNKLINDRRFPNENLDEAVGKEMADRILSGPYDMGNFTGIDLEVGGEGHIQMYDIDLPNMVKKYGKKWGAKVGKVGIALRSNPKAYPRTTAHYIDITPAMKESVMTEGQTMFMPAGSDASYMKAAKKGDTKGAQLLVDKAAKVAGYTIGPVYHGTQRDFTTFDKGLGMTGKLSGHPIAKYGFFFAHEKSTAKAYAGKDGKVLDAHLKIGRLYKADMHGKEINRLADDRGVAVDTKVGPWIKGLIEKGYDGIELSLFGKPHEIMVFDPSQIKSADPITKDNKGNIIPLSERFNPGSDDIRYMPKGKDVKVKPRKGSATARKTGTRIPMGAVAKQLRLERDLKKLKRN